MIPDCVLRSARPGLTVSAPGTVFSVEPKRYSLQAELKVKTPVAIIDKYHAAGMKVLNDPATQDRLKRLGVEPLPMTPAEMDDLVKRETASNLEVIRAAGIQQ